MLAYAYRIVFMTLCWFGAHIIGHVLIRHRMIKYAILDDEMHYENAKLQWRMFNVFSIIGSMLNLFDDENRFFEIMLAITVLYMICLCDLQIRIIPRELCYAFVVISRFLSSTPHTFDAMLFIFFAYYGLMICIKYLLLRKIETVGLGDLRLIFACFFNLTVEQWVTFLQLLTLLMLIVGLYLWSANRRVLGNTFAMAPVISCAWLVTLIFS